MLLLNSDLTVTGLPKNPNNAIVIRNVHPSSWSGRMFDCGIYKNNRLLVVQKEVHINDQVDFMLQPKISFAVARNLQVGPIFTSLEIQSQMTDFDLSEYPTGLVVTLDEELVGGAYTFTGTPMLGDAGNSM